MTLTIAIAWTISLIFTAKIGHATGWHDCVEAVKRVAEELQKEDRR